MQIQISPELMGKDLQLFDVQGRLVYKAKIDNLNTQLDLPKLANGVYMARMDSAVGRFIKE